MPNLKISSDLAIPLNAMVDKNFILATTGAGKTYLMRVWVEEVLRARQQAVVLDPKGDFWGLRSTVDGKSAGFPIPVFGGEHADLPLEDGSGGFIAELIVKERLSAIIDLSLFSKTKMHTWATEFAEQFYHRNREAMLLAIDEVHTFAPQKYKGNERMLGAFTDLVAKGRKRGIGTLCATQRSALVNKDVLDLAATLFFLRTTGPRDRDVVDDWLKFNASADVHRQIMESLAKLENGETWVYSPQSLKLLERIKVRAATTFDSSATPEPGKAIRKPKTLAEIDVDAVIAQMQDAVERAKADDPKELRKEIARLRRELQKRPTETKVEEVIKEIEVPIFKDGEVGRLGAATDKIGDAVEDLMDVTRAIDKAIQNANVELAAPAKQARGSRARPGREVRGPVKADVSARAPVPANTHGRTSGGARGVSAAPPDDIVLDTAKGRSPKGKILDALAWAEGAGLGYLERTQLALMVGQSPTSSAYGNHLGALRTAVLVDYPAGGRVWLTEQGRELAIPGDVPTTDAELHQSIFNKVGGAKTRILSTLIGEYPAAIERDALAELVGQSPTSSAYGNHLGALRSLGLIDYPERGYVVALPVLFLSERV